MYKQYPPLIEALNDPTVYPHAVDTISIKETHISWILLTGEFAYKIKKPVKFDFLDFSSLEKRQHYCQEEYRLNQRLAPAMYLQVCPIYGTPQSPRFNKSGAIIEYAVKMIQFAQENQLDEMLINNVLRLSHIDEIASKISDFHKEANIAQIEKTFGDPQKILQPVLENIKIIRPYLRLEQDRVSVDQLQCWIENEFSAHVDEFKNRKRNGYIRECHGDMHLSNIALINNEVVFFDCIEFSEKFRWIDTMSEIAFLAIDLVKRKHPVFANRFINAYLQHTGDYQGLSVLRFYKVYRALVRAKVVCLRQQQILQWDDKTRELETEYLEYVHLAVDIIRSHKPLLAITHGLSGVGKSTLSQQLVDRMGFITLRSDIERKRLFNLDAISNATTDFGAGIYSKNATQSTYDKLKELATQIIKNGYSVIVDATFLDQIVRQRFSMLAKDLHVPFVILHCRAQSENIKQRITERKHDKQNVSDANINVLNHQLVGMDPLTEKELDRTIAVDLDLSLNLDRLVDQLNNLRCF